MMAYSRYVFGYLWLCLTGANEFFAVDNSIKNTSSKNISVYAKLFGIN